MLNTMTDQRMALRPVSLPEAAFLFADVAGFAAFTELQGDVDAAALAWRLRLGVEEQLGHDAHVIKTLGDAVMVRIAEPAEAAIAGLRIVSRALPGAGDPPVRVGIHYGPAVEWDGDYFGAAVNLAARVASLAGPGEILVTADVAVAARRHGLQIEELGERILRNVARPVRLHAVRNASDTGTGRVGMIPACSLRRGHRGSGSFATSRAAADVQL
jgi:adenylate cyclase